MKMFHKGVYKLPDDNNSTINGIVEDYSKKIYVDKYDPEDGGY